MDISTETNKSDENRTVHFLAGLQSSRASVVRSLIGLFTLTKEDKQKAGIYVGSEGPSEEIGQDKTS